MQRDSFKSFYKYKPIWFQRFCQFDVLAGIYKCANLLTQSFKFFLIYF